MSDHEHEINIEAYRAAREARNLEIGLFWQRSNYFLVLSTAIGAAFFSLKDATYSVSLASFGIVVGWLWFRVSLGGKFWQSRWEHRLNIIEKQLRPDMKLFSADSTTVNDDVRQSFAFRERGWLHRKYQQRVLSAPSVSYTMTALSVAFTLLWCFLLGVRLWHWWRGA
jgi:hypothetical protein